MKLINRKQFLFIGAFSLVFWWAMYAPLFIILGFTWKQWVGYLTIGLVYDVFAEPIGGYITVKFDEFCKQRGWYS